MERSVDKNEIDMLEGARERREQVKAINEEPKIQKLI